VEAVLGTNPVAIGLPRQDEPVVADIATTSTTYCDCRLAIDEGRPLAEGQGLDASGRPTTDARQVIEGGSLLPLGEHKGYALAIAVQLLCTALTGASAVPGLLSDYGILVLALRRDILVGPGVYEAVSDELLAAVKGAKPARAGQPPLLPGERSAANRRRAAVEGIEVGDELYAQLFGPGEPAG
jgi:LDH2 family malate/lactate/ureidoglycolate dehydrogenase